MFENWITEYNFKTCMRSGKNRTPEKSVDLKLNKTGLGDRSGVGFSELAGPPLGDYVPTDRDC